MVHCFDSPNQHTDDAGDALGCLFEMASSMNERHSSCSSARDHPKACAIVADKPP
jgi:hypothetical protein